MPIQKVTKKHINRRVIIESLCGNQYTGLIMSVGRWAQDYNEFTFLTIYDIGHSESTSLGIEYWKVVKDLGPAN